MTTAKRPGGAFQVQLSITWAGRLTVPHEREHDGARVLALVRRGGFTARLIVPAAPQGDGGNVGRQRIETQEARTTVRRRYPLNPCDYLFLAHHWMMQQAGQIGNLPYMVMDLDGGVNADAISAGVRRALEAHPVLRGRIRLSLFWARPYWHVDDGDELPLEIVDLRNEPDWRAAADARIEAGLARGWDVYRAPQVRIELYLGGDGQARLCLRWPHALMDAEGAQRFLAEVERLGVRRGGTGHPDHDTSRRDEPFNRTQGGEHRGGVGNGSSNGDQASAGDKPLDLLAGRGLLDRVGLFRRGLKLYRGADCGGIERLARGPAAGGTWRICSRRWDGDEWSHIRRRAAERCPQGSARFSRYLGGCVLRALHRLLEERSVPVEECLVTLPMRVRGTPAARPLVGNYLVSATLSARRDEIADKQRLLDGLSRQIEGFLKDDADLANWALVWGASFLRARQYRWLLSGSWGLQPYASGFSYYGEIDPPIRRFGGARVTNLWGSGTMSAPPGWNPVFSRFGESLNLGLTWLEGYFDRSTAERYAGLIEGELLNG
ncbi:MAG: hypothetical protein HUU22_15830 [Phycisphaerae bacterium]|nr:hypothetical protein [Phycisphaerae bacterium]NUQ47490.1 hypothetical protein [Phycisphaerae bacterium]